MFKKSIIALFAAGILMYLSIASIIAPYTSLDTKKTSDVIIILGAKVMKDTTLNPCLVARVAHGADLYKDGFAQKIIVSGGIDRETGKSESEGMKQVAQNNGVRTDDIIEEPRATSTYENLLYAQTLMKTHNFKTAIVVTEPFHAARAHFVASKLGLSHTLSSTQTSPCWNTWKFLSRYFLREIPAVVLYKINDRI